MRRVIWIRAIAGSAILGAAVVALWVLTQDRRSPPRPAAQGHSAAHVLTYPCLDSSLWPATFDPATVSDSPSLQVLSLLYATLVRLDSQNHVVPDLAQSWQVNPAHTVYTFHLRPNARFSDGRPITAGDVAYSLARTLSPRAYHGTTPSPVALTYLGHIVGAAAYNTGRARTLRGVAVLGRHTVRITVDQPIAFFLQALSYPTGAIVAKGTPLGGLTVRNPLLHQVSSGPFRLASYMYRSTLTFVPNPGYYAARRIKLRHIEMPFVADPTTMYTAYESGQYPMTVVPANRLASARGKADTHRSPILAIDYIIYNVARSPFMNRALRLATSYAIDRDLINTAVLHGAQQTIYSLVPQGIVGYDARGKPVVPHYDPVQARRYLTLARKQLGRAFPASLTIKYAAVQGGTAQEYVALQDMWKRIGLHVQIQRIPLNTWLGLVVKPTPSLTYTGGEPWVQGLWGADYPDAQDFTTTLLASSSTHNVGNYVNPQFEALIARALTAHGHGREQLYVRAGRIALRDVAWAVIGQVRVTYRWRPNISGLAVWTSNITASPQPLNNDWTNVDVR